MELRHYIDGQTVEEPKGWGEFTEDIRRNYKERMIGTEYPIDVTFVGGAYATLSTLYDSQPCGIVSYVVKQACGNGVFEDAIQCSIVLSDIEFNLDRCEAKVKATDDGIGARVSNNKSVVVMPGAVQTKNGEELEPAETVALSGLNGYDWKEALRHCVSYITDLNATVVSDWYDALPDDEKWMVIDGQELRTEDGSSIQCKYTFDLLFNELGKKYNLWASAERDVDGSPVLRIEPEGYFNGSTSGVSFPSTRDLVRKVNQDRLFASIRVGSTTYEKDTVGYFRLPYLIARGFTEESFTLKCQCNTDAELDLVNRWVIDTNVIEDVVDNNNDEHDEKMFLIQYTESTGAFTLSTFDNAPVDNLYNYAIQNINVLNRFTYNCGVGIDFTDTTDLFFGAQINDGTQATYAYTGLGMGSPVTQQVGFNDDYSGSGNFDPGNNYGNGTTQGSNVAVADSRYTAAAQGVFYLTASVLMSYADAGIDFPQNGVRANLFMRVYSSTNVLIFQTPDTEVDMSVDGIYELNMAATISMNTGDYVTVWMRTEPYGDGGGSLAYSVTTGINTGVFRLEGTELGGGSVVNTDPDDYYGTIYDFERHCTLDQWKTIRDDHTISVGVSTRTQVFNGYPLNCSRNLKTGETKWELIAKRV